MMSKGAKGIIDSRLAVSFGVWLMFGLIMLTSAGVALGYDKFGDRYFFIKRQILFGLLPGLILFFIAIRLKFRQLRFAAIGGYFAAVILLCLVFVPGIGSTLNTFAHSWIEILGFTFQPSEFAKLALILYLALFLSKKHEVHLNTPSGFVTALVIGLLPVGLVVLEPDLGTASILFAIMFVQLILARANWKYLGLLLGVSILGIVIMAFTSSYRTARLTTFLHPEANPMGEGYQINQAFLALGSGGLFGLGFNHSRQKFQYLPEVNADSIFAIIGEELGFVLATLFIFFILYVGLRSFELAARSDDDFVRLAIGGIATWLMAQSFLNIGAMAGILPLTGVPLPFVSHGGTALMFSLAGAGVLLNLTRNCNLPVGSTKAKK